MREATADAPGRVNLIGEHTDYHQGYVLPCVIPQRTRARVVARGDFTVRASSRETGETREYVIGAEGVTHTWLDYVQGITHALGTVTKSLTGFDVHIESDVPLGSGLSSSAALEVSVLRALRSVFALPIDDVELARIGQRAETDFVGAPVGIMDQMVCSLGQPGHALFLDTRSLAFERVALPPQGELVVIDSGVKHQHAGGQYVTRRRESFAAAEMLGAKYLRDVRIQDLARINALPEPLARRARHVVTENQRVLDAVAALGRGDLECVGPLFFASHASMRDDYETSTPEIDALVALAREDADVFGARLTGGGFGGAVVILARGGRAVDVAQRVLQRHGDSRASVLLPVQTPVTAP
jgi:galactokinase